MRHIFEARRARRILPACSLSTWSRGLEEASDLSLSGGNSGFGRVVLLEFGPSLLK